MKTAARRNSLIPLYEIYERHEDKTYFRNQKIKSIHSKNFSFQRCHTILFDTTLARSVKYTYLFLNCMCIFLPFLNKVFQDSILYFVLCILIKVEFWCHSWNFIIGLGYYLYMRNPSNLLKLLSTQTYFKQCFL